MWQKINEIPPAAEVVEYTIKDAVLYVLTLCLSGTAISYLNEVELERWLGAQWVLGWFALDAVWNPNSKQKQFDRVIDYLPFGIGLAVHLALLQTLQRDILDWVNVGVVAFALIYWVYTERGRGSLRILFLYGSAAIIAAVVCAVKGLSLAPPSWFYYFVALQFSTTDRCNNPWYSRLLHAWIWSPLVFDLGTDNLDFSQWFN